MVIYPYRCHSLHLLIRSLDLQCSFYYYSVLLLFPGVNFFSLRFFSSPSSHPFFPSFFYYIIAFTRSPTDLKMTTRVLRLAPVMSFNYLVRVSWQQSLRPSIFTTAVTASTVDAFLRCSLLVMCGQPLWLAMSISAIQP